MAYPRWRKPIGTEATVLAGAGLVLVMILQLVVLGGSG